MKHGRGRPRLSARKDLEAMQAAACEAAETANLLKEKFLALLSHELRTPLNLILGCARMLQSNVTPPEMLRLAAEKIGRLDAKSSSILADWRLRMNNQSAT